VKVRVLRFHVARALAGGDQGAFSGDQQTRGAFGPAIDVERPFWGCLLLPPRRKQIRCQGRYLSITPLDRTFVPTRLSEKLVLIFVQASA
jgi:hypothetical protein